MNTDFADDSLFAFNFKCSFMSKNLNVRKITYKCCSDSNMNEHFVESQFSNTPKTNEHRLLAILRSKRKKEKDEKKKIGKETVM